MTDRTARTMALIVSIVALVGAWGVSAGVAKGQLGTKEDREDHNADVVRLQSSMRDVRDSLRLQQFRAEQRAQADSFFRTDVLRQLGEIKCAVKPTGRGC